VAEVELGVDAEYLEVTGLDINAHGGLYLIKFYLRNIHTTSSNDFKLYVEGDYTDTNYYTQWLTASGTTVSATRPNDPRFITVGIEEGARGVFWIQRLELGRITAYVPVGAQWGGAYIAIYHRLLSTIPTHANLTSIRIQSGIVGAYLGAGSKIEVYRFA